MQRCTAIAQVIACNAALLDVAAVAYGEGSDCATLLLCDQVLFGMM